MIELSGAVFGLLCGGFFVYFVLSVIAIFKLNSKLTDYKSVQGQLTNFAGYVLDKLKKYNEVEAGIQSTSLDYIIQRQQGKFK